MTVAGFQTSVVTGPAPGIEGDFCSANQWYSVVAGPGGLVAGANGLVAGRFAWLSASSIDTDGAPAIANNTGSGTVAGFVHRDLSGLITLYPPGSSTAAADLMKIPAGFAVTLLNGGDFWVKNVGTATALYGMKAYARFADGTVNFAAAGGAGDSGSAVTASVAASTGSFTGTITGDVMKITAVGSGVVVPGGTLSGSGVASGTKVVSQLTGAAGGIGTYAVSIGEQTVTSTTISETYGTMTVTAVGSGTLGVGDALTAGTNVIVGTNITALGTGTGGTGTYIVDNNTVVGSTAVTVGGSVETKWYAVSAGLTNELVKISSHPNG